MKITEDKRHFAETLLVIQKNYKEKSVYSIIDFVSELQYLSENLQVLNLQACNIGLSERQEKRLETLKNRVILLCACFGCDCEVNGDPRGWPIKLKLPEGSNNELGGGWGI